MKGLYLPVLGHRVPDANFSSVAGANKLGADEEQGIDRNGEIKLTCGKTFE